MERLVSTHAFVNKLWNAGKFILLNLEQVQGVLQATVQRCDEAEATLTVLQELAHASVNSHEAAERERVRLEEQYVSQDARLHAAKAELAAARRQCSNLEVEMEAVDVVDN